MTCHRSIASAMFALALLAPFVAAQSTTVTVNANQGPWVQSLNPSFNYGDGTNAAPTAVSASSGIPFSPGGTVTVTYVSGLVNVFPEGGFTATDADGYPGDATNNTVLANGSYPSYFISSSSYPVYASELIGTFANNGVIVGNPFPVGDGPKTFTIPSGANQLLLGVDDNDYADNTGSWQIKVTYAPARDPPAGTPVVTSSPVPTQRSRSTSRHSPASRMIKPLPLVTPRGILMRAITASCSVAPRKRLSALRIRPIAWAACSAARCSVTRAVQTSPFSP